MEKITMKLSNVLLAVTALVFAAGSLCQSVQAADPVDVTTVQMGEVTVISATIQNSARKVQKAAVVNVVGMDENGNIVANLGMPVVVRPNTEETVSREWQAPNYQTDLTWKAKVVAFREDPIDHNFGWKYPKLQHRMSGEAKNPATCQNCHSINTVNKDEPMNCYNCHGHHWN